MPMLARRLSWPGGLFAFPRAPFLCNHVELTEMPIMAFISAHGNESRRMS
jgi:hypothetical protein